MKKRLSSVVVLTLAMAACVGSELSEPQDGPYETLASEGDSAEQGDGLEGETGLDLSHVKMLSGKAIYQEQCIESTHLIAQGSLNANGFRGFTTSNARNIAVNPADGMLYSVHTNAAGDFEIRRTADGVSWSMVHIMSAFNDAEQPAMAIRDNGDIGLVWSDINGYRAAILQGGNLGNQLFAQPVLTPAVVLSAPSIAASSDEFYVAIAHEQANGLFPRVTVARLAAPLLQKVVSLPTEFPAANCDVHNHENVFPSIAVGRRYNVQSADEKDELFVSVSERMTCNGLEVIASPLWTGTMEIGKPLGLVSSLAEAVFYPLLVGSGWSPAGLSVAANDSGRAYIAHAFSSNVMGPHVLLHAYQDAGNGVFDHDVVNLGGTVTGVSVAAHPTDANAFKVASSNPIRYAEGSWSLSGSGSQVSASTRTLTEPGSHRTPNAAYWSTCDSGFVCELTTAFGARTGGLNLALHDEMRCCKEACSTGNPGGE